MHDDAQQHSDDELRPGDRAADTSVLVVLDAFADAGWTANHTAEPDGQVRCGSCGTVVDASRLTVGARHRTEGASDPDDMQIVLGLVCPNCDERGVLVAGYGPNTSDLDRGVLDALEIGSDLVDPVANPT